MSKSLSARGDGSGKRKRRDGISHHERQNRVGTIGPVSSGRPGL